MKLKYFKKIFAVSLMGFLFVFNSIPVSFAQSAQISPAWYPGDNCPTGCQPYTNGTVGGKKAGSYVDDSGNNYVSCYNCGQGVTTPPPIKGNPSECTPTAAETSAAIVSLKCTTGSTPIWDKENCKFKCSCPTPTSDKPKCPTNQEAIWNADTCKYVCNPSTILPQDESLKAIITPYKARVTIPCSTTVIGVNGKCPVADNPAGYIARLYQFGLMIVGFVALGAIIFGAAQYTLSAGNMASKEEGKAWMLNAIYGILLLLGAYLILYTINPSLVSLTNPSIEPINLDLYTPPPTFVGNTDCSQVKPDNSKLAGQECGTDCKIDPTTTNGCSANGNPNTPGGTAYGCEVLKSNGGILGASITNNGQQIANTSDQTTMVCSKCFADYTLDNGQCCLSIITKSCVTCGGLKDSISSQLKSGFDKAQAQTILMSDFGQNQGQALIKLCNF